MCNKQAEGGELRAQMPLQPCWRGWWGAGCAARQRAGAGEMAGISACPGWHLVQGRSVRGEGKRHARFAELDASFVFAFTALPVPGIENCDTAQPSPENMRLV